MRNPPTSFHSRIKEGFSLFWRCVAILDMYMNTVFFQIITRYGGIYRITNVGNGQRHSHTYFPLNGRKVASP